MQDTTVYVRAMTTKPVSSQADESWKLYKKTLYFIK